MSRLTIYTDCKAVQSVNHSLIMFKITVVLLAALCVANASVAVSLLMPKPEKYSKFFLIINIKKDILNQIKSASCCIPQTAG